MQKGTLLIFTGFAVAAGISYVVYNNAKKLEALQLDANLVDFKFSDSSKRTINVRMNVLVYNPNTDNIPYESFIGNIFYKGSILSNIDPAGGNNLIFKARQTTILPIKVAIDATKLAGSVIDVLSNILLKQKTAIAIVLKGNLKAAGLVAPIEKTLNINL